MLRVKILKKPWGEEHLFALAERYAGKILVIHKGHRLSLQYHEKKEETLYVDQGLLKLTLAAGKGKYKHRVLGCGEMFHLPPGTVHRMEAVETCRLIEVSTPELEDVVRLEDDYNRACTKEKDVDPS